MEARIEALEIKIMELEHTVNTLNTVVTQQYQLLDQLQQQSRELSRKVDLLSDSVTTDERDEPPPPHY